jgi:NAD(P)-dependent dehydrogenase (short-subunit alcohol dehydrogenase family)
MSVLKDRHIFITGGGRGIGQTIALDCKKNGAKVSLIARSPDDLANTEKLLSEIPGEHLVLKADVTNAVELEKAMDQSVQKLGPLTGLVAAAGIYGEIGRFHEANFDEWLKGLEINLVGTARSVHLAVPRFKKGARNKIVLFSGGGQGPAPYFSSYATSKGGVSRFTETVGAELDEVGIDTNGIAPGPVNTKFLDDLLATSKNKISPAVYEKALKQKEQGGQPPEKAADLCRWLLSSASDGLWGKTLSAVWDPYLEFKNLPELSRKDLFQVRRVVDDQGNTRAK